eukprot:m.171962 g.171962  ORF g.171962 m.171962 type:complete len:93 (+) comp14566_c0_seq1:647-925(+)
MFCLIFIYFVVGPTLPAAPQDSSTLSILQLVPISTAAALSFLQPDCHHPHHGVLGWPLGVFRHTPPKCIADANITRSHHVRASNHRGDCSWL